MCDGGLNGCAAVVRTDVRRWSERMCDGGSDALGLVKPFIYESSLRAGHGTKGCFEASDCWRLGRQAADHPWSALRVVESCRKDCPTASVLLEAKAAALHPKRYQSSLSKLSTTDCLVKKPCGKKSAIAIYQRGRVRRGKEAQANGLARQSDRQKSGQIGDRQTD
jgi:hypothetical protein